jgi:hypothetical protein
MLVYTCFAERSSLQLSWMLSQAGVMAYVGSFLSPRSCCREYSILGLPEPEGLQGIEVLQSDEIRVLGDIESVVDGVLFLVKVTPAQPGDRTLGSVQSCIYCLVFFLVLAFLLPSSV